MNASAPRTTAGPAVGQATRTSTRRRIRGSHIVLAVAAVAVGGWVLNRSEPRVATGFEFTGSPQTYVVPAGICRLRVDIVGAAGGPGGTAGSPGAGAAAVTTLRVTPGEALRVAVGGWGGEAVGPTPGAGGWNGGGDGGLASGYPDGRPGKAGAGGGGATDIRRGSGGLESRIVVAAGGAGGAGGGIGGPIGTGGGNGGGASGYDGFAPLGTVNPATGGGGATGSAGGLAGRNAQRASRDRHCRSVRSRWRRRPGQREWRWGRRGWPLRRWRGRVEPLLQWGSRRRRLRLRSSRDGVPSRRRRRRREGNDLVRPRPRRV